MHVDPLEKGWVWVVGLMTGFFLIVIFYYALAYANGGFHPPSNVETIDGASMHLVATDENREAIKDGEFNEENLGVKVMEDGSVKVTMVAGRYGFYPQEITVPANTPITLRMASFDTIHGFHVEQTNMASMVIPGFVTEVKTELQVTGELPLYCNEYCGLGHHYMWSKVKVVPKDEFAAK